MLFSGFWRRFWAGWRAFRDRPEVGMGAPAFQQDQPRHDGFAFPPGTRAVLTKVEEATLDGMPGVVFRRGEFVLSGENDEQIALYRTNRVRLPGCNCSVAGPNDVLYYSDISGLPVCRRCGAECVCGHKVAPHERVTVGRRTFMCKVCYEEQKRQLRREKIKQLLLGPFAKE